MAFKSPNLAKKGLWRRTPPAVFPPIMGLFGLGLGWRRIAGDTGLPPGFAETILGAVTLLFAFAVLAYGAKLLRRPAVILEDLRVLPGSAGLSAMVLCPYLLVLTLLPLAGPLAGLLFGGLACHGVLVILLIWALARGPAEQRRVSPVWHLSFVGFIIAALAAIRIGLGSLSLLLFALTFLMAAAIWAVSAERLITEKVPPPLRPLLAIHLSPAALFGLVAKAQGLDVVAAGFAVLSAILLAAMILNVRWLTAASFSPLWGAFTFPLAATATLWLTLDGIWFYPGVIVLLGATVIVPWIAFRVIKLWASGRLAILTNAAAA